jgi:hypothetical protein
LVGSIYGRFSIRIAHLVRIRWQTWPPQAILGSDWLISKIFSSETAWPNDPGEDFFRNQPIRIRNGLSWPCLLTDRNEISNRHKWSSIDASYQVSVHLAKWFQRRRFKKIGQSETRIACVVVNTTTIRSRPRRPPMQI